MCFGGGSGAEEDIQKSQLEREQRIQSGLGEINRVFSSFGPDFYKQAENVTLGNLMPQVARQYKQANTQMNYGLANQGLLNSTVANRFGDSLNRELAQNKVMVANQALDAGRQLQNQIQTQKQNVINQLQASADPTLAAQSAAGAAANVQLPSMLAPLGNMFQNWTNSYVAGRMANAYNQMGNTYNDKTPVATSTGLNFNKK